MMWMNGFTFMYNSNDIIAGLRLIGSKAGHFEVTADWQEIYAWPDDMSVFSDRDKNALAIFGWIEVHFLKKGFCFYV